MKDHQRAILRRVAAGALLVTLSGCGTGYVLRAAYEEARILWRRQPIDSLLAGDIEAETREKLLLTRAVREFARDELGLSVGGSYTSVARVDADQVVHIVTAAPRDRLVAHTWWFPLVGRMPYRAYFNREAAQRLASSLERDGYDTYVRPAVAFSTLGWFDDPLLSNVLRREPVQMVEIIIHEFLHGTVWIPNSASFNESFATFVGCRGASAFFAGAGQKERAHRAEALWADALRFSDFLSEMIDRLKSAYATGIDPERREQLFRALQRKFDAREWQTSAYQDFASGTLNNAVIVHHQLYADRLDLFERAYVRNERDLAKSIIWIREQVRSAAHPYAALSDALNALPTAEFSPTPA